MEGTCDLSEREQGDRLADLCVRGAARPAGYLLASRFCTKGVLTNSRAFFFPSKALGCDWIRVAVPEMD